MRYLLLLDISSADSDCQIVGRPHGATILDRIMKNETANSYPPPTQIMDEAAQKPKLMRHFSILFGGLGWGRRYNFPSISYKHRRQPGGILNINYSRLCDEIPAPGGTRNTCEGKATMTN